MLIGAAEMAWALEQPWGYATLPELYIRELDGSKQLTRIRAGDESKPELADAEPYREWLTNLADLDDLKHSPYRPPPRRPRS